MDLDHTAFAGKGAACLLYTSRTLEEVFMQLTAQDALVTEQEQPRTENESEEKEGKTDGSDL